MPSQRASALFLAAKEKATPIAAAAVEKATPIAAEAAKSIRTGAEQLSARAHDDPNVGPALRKISAGWADVTGWAQSTWRDALARAKEGGPERDTRGL